MTDMASNPPRIKSRRAEGMEYRVYFAVIFAAALPFCLLSWAGDVLRRAGLPEKGPVARARSQARIVTPIILSV